MKYLFIIFLAFTSYYAHAQIDKRVEVDGFTPQLDSAIQLMDDSLYFKANELFLVVLDSNEVLPDELCFYFGKNLFLTGYKDQSRAFLYRYLALRDTSDQFYESAQEYLHLLGEDIIRYHEAVAEEKIEVENFEKEIRRDDDPCHGEEVFICPVCSGTTVIVRKTNFGSTYQTCPYCTEEGIMDCETYEKYLRGELNP